MAIGIPKRENLVMKVIEWLGGFIRPEISGDTELLADVTTTDKRAKVVIQMPEIAKAIARDPEITSKRHHKVI
jgi:hypothetical protein